MRILVFIGIKVWTLLSPPLFDVQLAQEALLQRKELRMNNMQNSNVLMVSPAFHDASGAFPIHADGRLTHRVRIFVTVT
jgi:hypothetical protein